MQCRQAPFLPDARRFGQTVTSLSEAIAVFWPLGYALTGRRQAVETTIPGMHRAVQRPTELSTAACLKGPRLLFSSTSEEPEVKKEGGAVLRVLVPRPRKGCGQAHVCPAGCARKLPIGDSDAEVSGPGSGLLHWGELCDCGTSVLRLVTPGSLSGELNPGDSYPGILHDLSLPKEEFFLGGCLCLLSCGGLIPGKLPFQ